MKHRDRENLKFLLNASPETLNDWYTQASDDDVQYASELLILAELELQDRLVLSSKDCVDAQKILEKFTKG